MADLTKTNLVLVASPIPADFEGTPQEFFEALVERLEIQSPVGTNFFVVGDVEPNTNQGPWLKGGTQWWVFSSTEGRYVPQDISASTEALFTVSATEPDAPQEGDASIWLRTESGRVIAWYFWTGTEWRPGGNVPPSGPTASRPSTPKELEQFFDTSINVLLHWERGKWRTVSGTPGDVKFVTTLILEEALTANPGWNYLGDGASDYIGRVLGVASKDPGGSPESFFSTESGITARSAGETTGSETHVLTSDEIEQHTHLIGCLENLNSDNNTKWYRVDDGESLIAPSPLPPNHARILGETTANGTRDGELPTPSAGTMFVTSKQLSATQAAAYTEAAEPHNIVQPTKFLWALTKE